MSKVTKLTKLQLNHSASRSNLRSSTKIHSMTKNSWRWMTSSSMMKWTIWLSGVKTWITTNIWKIGTRWLPAQNRKCHLTIMLCMFTKLGWVISQLDLRSRTQEMEAQHQTMLVLNHHSTPGILQLSQDKLAHRSSLEAILSNQKKSKKTCSSRVIWNTSKGWRSICTSSMTQITAMTKWTIQI